jgi:hypothetical protein
MLSHDAPCASMKGELCYATGWSTCDWSEHRQRDFSAWAGSPESGLSMTDEISSAAVAVLPPRPGGWLCVAEHVGCHDSRCASFSVRCVCRSRTRPATGEFERGGAKETASAVATQPRPTPFKAKVHMPSLLEELLAHAGQPGRAASMFALFRAIHKGGSAAASMEPFISLTWSRRAPPGFFS